jgi:hypothetical protein
MLLALSAIVIEGGDRPTPYLDDGLERASERAIARLSQVLFSAGWVSGLNSVDSAASYRWSPGGP